MEKKSKVRLTFMPLVWALILCMPLSGCGLIPVEEELPSAPYLVEAETTAYVFSPVLVGDIVKSEVIRCYYIASSVEKLSFDIGGEYISNVYVELGDTVKAGDVLMELNVSAINQQIVEQQQQLQSLRTQINGLYTERDLALEAARVEDQQAAALGNENWSSREESVEETYDRQIGSLALTINVAQQRLEELNNEKAQRQLIAGIDGVVTSMRWRDDNYRTVKGETLIEVSDMSGAMFVAYSSNASLLEEGGSYMLECNNETYEVTAHYGENLENDQLDPESWYLELMIPDPSIEKDDSGNVRVVLESVSDVLYIQMNLIKDVGGKSVVYVLDENGYKTAREVVTGLSDGKNIQILSGLSEGEYVIVP